jgi:hypothetical protein
VSDVGIAHLEKGGYPLWSTRASERVAEAAYRNGLLKTERFQTPARSDSRHQLFAALPALVVRPVEIKEVETIKEGNSNCAN